MKSTLKKFYKRTTHRGYTLMEMMVTVVILGIIFGLAIPRFTFSIEKSRAAEGIQILDALYTAQNTFLQERGTYAWLFNQLDVTIPTAANFAAPVLWSPGLGCGNCAVAQIQRLGNSYTLSVTEDGRIMCSGGPANYCTKLGY